MCGICGVYNFQKENSVNEDVLVHMRDTMYHRGPDDAGVFIDKNVGMGIRRLSIIDLDTGHQPISNEDGTIWVVLNGEIYNFLELRDELESKGHRFRTKTDTEVIVHLYEEMGGFCVEKMIGMFGFAVWDSRKKVLYIARDRLGVKPLFYAQTKSSVIFASEIKAILKHPEVKKELDLDSLSRYLTLEFIPAPHTIFKGIKKLIPGHTLTIKNNVVKIDKYWEIKYENHSDITEDDCRDKILDLLSKSVKRRLISDVPIGVFLSGGIDSSSIAALTKINSNNSDVKTFTIGFKEASFDESEHASKASGYLGTSHHQKILEPINVVELIGEVMKYLDEPLGDASIIPTYLLSKFTREYVKVALSGDGGDELFAGYPTYQAHKLMGIYSRIPSFIRERIIEKAIRRLPVSKKNFSLDFRLKKFIQGINYPPEYRNFIWMGSFSPEDKNKLLREDILSGLEKGGSFDSMGLNNYNTEDLLNKILCVDIQSYLRDDLLPKVDIASMANSLEVRAPFLDHKLIEFAANIPSRLKLKGWTGKYILKRTMKDLLPPSVISRKKKGFGMPVAFWLQTEMREFITDIFSKSRMEKEGLFEYSVVEKLISDHLNNRADNRKPIWTLLIFELWYNKFFSN